MSPRICLLYHQRNRKGLSINLLDCVKYVTEAVAASKKLSVSTNWAAISTHSVPFQTFNGLAMKKLYHLCHSAGGSTTAQF